MFLKKQDVKNVPFQLIHEKVSLAVSEAVNNVTSIELEAYKRFITKKEEQWIDSHESPYEGNFEDIYPFSGVSEELLQETKAEAEKVALEEILAKLDLKNKSAWLLPQVMAYVANMKLPKVNGKIDGLEFLKINFVDDWHKGLYRYLTVGQRGLIVPSQATEQFRNYGALTPLMLMPFKKLDGVLYSSWINYSKCLDRSLREALFSDIPRMQLTSDHLIHIRNSGLTFKTGAKAGECRNAASTFKLYGLRTSAEDEGEAYIASLPWLRQVMETQIWLAHPSVRTDVMILDCFDLDSMPEPLINTEVSVPKKFNSVKSETIKKTISYSDLPWDE